MEAPAQSPRPQLGLLFSEMVSGERYNPARIGVRFMGPNMTRECDERMWNLAYRLAQSGEHQDYQSIEWQLRACGFLRAHQLLHHERVRGKLDGVCVQARKRFVNNPEH